MAASRLFALVSPSIIHNYVTCAKIRPKFNRITCSPSAMFKCYTSSALSIDSDASPLATDVSPHPWPEWVTFVDRLKSKGYFPKNASVSDSGANDTEEGSIYTEMNLLKAASLSFAHDRFDIIKSLSTLDIQAIVDKGCPNLHRKAVNSSKRLRAYLKLDEGVVCSSCNLRGACDKANVVLIEDIVGARTVDVIRILLNYALDPLTFSEKNKPPGRELIESSSRKLLLELIELDDTSRDPDLPKPESTTVRAKESSDLLDGRKSQNDGLLPGDWICTKCNFLNFMKNTKCRACGYGVYKRPISNDELKKGDWTCPGCNFMNFGRNMQCLKCSTDKPANVPSVDKFEKKKGDWDCPRCNFMNFAKNKECFQCQEPRPQRKLRDGDWECPECDFHNFFRNTVCKKCNLARPTAPSTLDEIDLHTWKRPY